MFFLTERYRKMASFRVCAVVAAICSMPIFGWASSHYVTPSGTASGLGTIGSPWDLQTALNQPATVIPGDTIWLRGGTYKGTFISKLTGAPGLPIVVRNYPGEWVVIDRGAPGLFPGTLQINGPWTWYWGFEVTNSDPTRMISSAGSNPPDARAQGITINGGASNIKLINLIVHDSGNGIVDNNGAVNNEIYGCLIYHNGWAGSDRSHGDGLYAQSAGGTKKFSDNIFFSGFNEGLNLYDSDQARLDNLDVEGNIALNSGILGRWFERNILVGGQGPCNNPLISNNYSYFSNYSAYGPGQPLNLGYAVGCQNATVLNNYFVSTSMFISNTNLTITGNTFAGVVNFPNANTPYSVIESYPGNIHIPYGTRPTGLATFVRPNLYEGGRGNIAIFNWGNLPSVDVDLSSVLTVGSSFEIRDAQNPLGTPLVTGTYSGAKVAIPMTSSTIVAPVGTTPQYWHTAPEFGAFLVVPPGTITPGSGPSAAVATPAISPNGGSGPAPLSVTISTTTPGATIYYTLDGTAPTTSSNLYFGPIALNASATVIAKAVKTGMTDSAIASATFTIIPATVATPTISPNGGNSTSAITVSLSSGTAGASIYYTTNGSAATSASTLYTAPFVLSASATVNAVAVKAGMTDSGTASATFTITPATVATPTISPNGGNSTSAITVSLSSATAGASIYYTTNGSAATSASTLYTAPFVLSASATVNAVAVKAGMLDSGTASATFTIIPATVAPPTISPSGGNSTSAVTVSLSSATAGASIYFTTNGSAATSSSILYTAPFVLSSSATVNAVAVKIGMLDSGTASATFTITPATVATPTISPNGGNSTSAVTVSLFSATAGASIYFTTNGSAATSASTLYTAPFVLSSSATVNAVAVKTGMLDSAAAMASFTISTGGGGSTSWYGAWPYRKAITVDHSRVTADLANFPVLVSLVDADLKSFAQGNGQDIVFTAADGSTKLNHEIESYDPLTGTLAAWVSVPTLSSAADTRIYLYFGNPAATAQATPAAVWDADFKAVWHMQQSPTGAAPQIKDSTLNNNHGTAYGNMLTSDQNPGVVGGSLTFDGKSKFINVLDSASLDTSPALTLSIWVKTTSAGFNVNLLNKGSGCINYGFAAWLNPNGMNPGAPAFWMGNSGWTQPTNLQVTDGNWHLVTTTHDGATSRVFVDGVLVSIGARRGLLNSTAPLRMAFGTCGNYLAGSLDEARVSGIARSAAWIAAEFANQSAPQTFESVAAVEFHP